MPRGTTCVLLCSTLTINARRSHGIISIYYKLLIVYQSTQFIVTESDCSGLKVNPVVCDIVICLIQQNIGCYNKPVRVCKWTCVSLLSVGVLMPHLS